MVSYVALALSIALGVIGQILLKYATTIKSALPIDMGPFNEMFAGAALIYAISLLLYTFSLQKIPLTIAYPSVSISYIGVALLSSFFFGTSIGVKDIVGFAFIALGVGLIGSSQT